MAFAGPSGYTTILELHIVCDTSTLGSPLTYDYAALGGKFHILPGPCNIGTNRQHQCIPSRCQRGSMRPSRSRDSSDDADCLTLSACQGSKNTRMRLLEDLAVASEGAGLVRCLHYCRSAVIRNSPNPFVLHALTGTQHSRLEWRDDYKGDKIIFSPESHL